jgi:hypothetical protein
VVLFPDGKICNKDPLCAFKESTNPGRGSWKKSDKGQYFMVLILLVAIPLTIHSLDLLVLKQITRMAQPRHLKQGTMGNLHALWIYTNKKMAACLTRIRSSSTASPTLGVGVHSEV